MKNIIAPDDFRPGVWLTPYEIKPPKVHWDRPEWDRPADEAALMGVPIQRHAQPQVVHAARGGHYSVDGRPYQIQSFAYPFLICLEPLTSSLCTFDVRCATFSRLPKDYVDTFKSCRNNNGMLAMTTVVKEQVFDLPTHEPPERMPTHEQGNVRHRGIAFFTNDASDSHAGRTIQGSMSLDRHDGPGEDMGIVRPDHPTLTSFICDSCHCRLQKTPNAYMIECPSCNERKMLNAQVVEEVERQWTAVKMSGTCSRCGHVLQGADRLSEDLRCGECQKVLEEEERNVDY